MKPRTTLILAVLTAGLFAYVWFVERKRPSTKEALEQAQQVTKIDRENFDTISIKSSDGGKVELRKKDGVWNVEEPVKDRADSAVINQLFTTAEGLKFDATVGEPGENVDKAKLKDYGLDDPKAKIRFAGKDKPVEYEFGSDAAVEGKVYMRVDGKPGIFVIGNDFKNQVAKKAEDFRDKKLTDITTSLVNKAAIKTAKGELEMEKKKDNNWSITKPLAARGDANKIGDLISQAATAHIESFVADSANLSAYGLQEPRGTVTFQVEGSKEPQVLLIGSNPEKDKEKTYAKLNTRDSVVLLQKSIETLLDTKPNDVRDKSLVRVEADIVDRMTIESPGKEKIVLARSGEKWVRKMDKDVPINNAAAKKLLDDLRGQQVANFVADVATDLPKYGLDKPQVQVTLSSYASENTAETKAGEKPIVSVLFGKVEGENVYAKLDEEPFIVSVNKSILDSILTDPLQWQELTIYKFKPEEIASLEVTRKDQPAVSLERDKDNQWKLSKGDGKVNQINVQSLVNTLTTLRAVRWTGPVKPESGLDKPEVKVGFKTTGNTLGKLTIGATNTEEMSNATADGLNGVFLMSRPDVEALRLPLLEGAEPAPLPAGPAPATGASATTPPVTIDVPGTEPPTATPQAVSPTPQTGSNGSSEARPPSESHP